MTGIPPQCVVAFYVRKLHSFHAGDTFFYLFFISFLHTFDFTFHGILSDTFRMKIRIMAYT